LPGFRHTTIGDRKGHKLDPARATKFSFTLQSEFGNFLLFEKTYYHIKTGGLPFVDFRFQPIIRAGTAAIAIRPAVGT